ncbi:PH domain-containing protein [Allopontixanthobacter sp.]|uniref:PH domain-containing protein n=1 Tax=Allopontixanthobacter sp. TaxID=2906452 RepID=UPI002ABCD272|nr:PH domain-containing protein [Allopontixanthobacter sp.]MDZ4307095.1 PH domain-containing protein [Allopontixanthobacter sp.]
MDDTPPAVAGTEPPKPPSKPLSSQDPVPRPEDAPGFGDDTLTPLHPNHVKVLRIEISLFTVPFVIGSLVLETALLLPAGSFIVPVVLAAALLIIRVPLRRYHARGFAMGADRLRVVRGLLFRSDTVVPFGRVQHIDVNQGPLERAYGLATLTLHTAGSHNASVHLPGLLNEDALSMRETIRAHIKRETV